MILILHANCIIYIWRICDLPLCRHIQTNVQVHIHVRTQIHSHVIHSTSYLWYVRKYRMLVHIHIHTRIYTQYHMRILTKSDCAIFQNKSRETDMLTYCDCPLFISYPPDSTATALVYEQFFARTRDLWFFLEYRRSWRGKKMTFPKFDSKISIFLSIIIFSCYYYAIL